MMYFCCKRRRVQQMEIKTICYNYHKIKWCNGKKVASLFFFYLKGYTDKSSIKHFYIDLINHRGLNAINIFYKLGCSSSLCCCDIERYSYDTVTYIYTILPHSLPNVSHFNGGLYVCNLSFGLSWLITLT